MTTPTKRCPCLDCLQSCGEHDALTCLEYLAWAQAVADAYCAVVGGQSQPAGMPERIETREGERA